ncbi:MAG TPA: metal ABC transporter permease [Armatimonadota bacterium]|jgi:ABC-type Mn2+/Zn2+ transport system permease subunit
MNEHLGFWQALTEFAFMRQALVAALIVGGLCSVLSVYVVLRRMAFIGQGISHAAFGGIALGLLLFGASPAGGVAVSLVTAVFCLAVAVLIGVVSQRGRMSADSAIGIFFAFSMALGVLFVSLRHLYTADLMTYLFGSILAVSADDLKLMAALGALILGFIGLSFKELIYFSFDSQMAWASGLPTGFYHYALLTMLALTIVVSAKVVGVVLVSAFLVIPGATARLVCSRFGSTMAVAVGFGVLSAFLGLYASHLWNVPTGATIVITQFVGFSIAWLIAGRGR